MSAENREEAGMILLGSTFPLTLIRRPVRIVPATLEELRERAAETAVLSFWGHDNTRAAAADILGFDPMPEDRRPALRLNDAQLPVLRKGDKDVAFSEVWVLSPSYIPGYRPEIGAEVPAEKIIAWQVLRITFEPEP
jgi:hypothetical protein